MDECNKGFIQLALAFKLPRLFPNQSNQQLRELHEMTTQHIRDGETRAVDFRRELHQLGHTNTGIAQKLSDYANAITTALLSLEPKDPYAS